MKRKWNHLAQFYFTIYGSSPHSHTMILVHIWVGCNEIKHIFHTYTHLRFIIRRSYVKTRSSHFVCCLVAEWKKKSSKSLNIFRCLSHLLISSPILQHLSNSTYYLKLDHAALIVFHEFCFHLSRFGLVFATRKVGNRSWNRRKIPNLSPNLKSLNSKPDFYWK